ncbi:hypothetical protein ACHAXR_001092, partial [Thalassiosira sp. AJA248-18]
MYATKNDEEACQASVTMRRGHNGIKLGIHFLQLKSSVMNRLKKLRILMKEQSNDNIRRQYPKEVIAAQSDVRELIQQVNAEWNELNEVYKQEVRKKRSKFTEEDLEVQQALVVQLEMEIQRVEEEQLAVYYVQEREGTHNPKLNLGSLGKLGVVHPPNSTPNGNSTKEWHVTSSATLAGAQQVQLHQIQDRDAEFDDVELGAIDEGIQDLYELAIQQGKEAKQQKIMLEDSLQTRLDPALEH